MNVRTKKTWVAALGLALALSTAGGVALAGPAESPGTDDATLPDPYNVGSLKLYNAGGTQVTSGTVTTPLAAFAAADAPVRAGDEYGTLFIHLPQSSNAPGAWPGVQATGTDKFAGAGAVSAPAPVNTKPFVGISASAYELADVIAALPNNEAGATFVGVYELRLRTSSTTKGVADQYASAYLKVTGSNWALTTAPVLGGGGGPSAPVGTSVAATWPSALTYGSPATVSATVNPASGSTKPTGTARLVNGSTTLATATLSAAGTATFTLPGTALPPGSATLKVVYAGATGAFNGSESSPKPLTVAKAAPGKPTFKATTKPTSKKKGAATITVPIPSGLAAATGSVSIVIKKGKVTKTVAGTLKAGTVSVKLPKLPVGKWTVTITFQGSSYYLATTSKAYKLKVKS